MVEAAEIAWYRNVGGEKPPASLAVVQMFAETPSSRRIWVIWRYDREDDQIPDVFGDLDQPAIFVIIAY